MIIDVCTPSRDVFDKDMNFLVSDAEKQDQSGKENSAANDLGIFEEINEEKICEEEPGVAISSQLDKVTMKCCSEESKNPAVVNKIPCKV